MEFTIITYENFELWNLMYFFKYRNYDLHRASLAYGLYCLRLDLVFLTTLDFEVISQLLKEK